VEAPWKAQPRKTKKRWAEAITKHLGRHKKLDGGVARSHRVAEHRGGLHPAVETRWLLLMMKPEFLFNLYCVL